MGTNIYAIPKAKVAEWKSKFENSIKEAQDANLIRLLPIIESYYNDRIPQKIHIGKRSAGWRFLFNHNDWRYYKTIDDLIVFLGQCEITTEYGEILSFKDFWTDVTERQERMTPSSEKNGYSSAWITCIGEYEFSTSTEFC